MGTGGGALGGRAHDNACQSHQPLIIDLSHPIPAMPERIGEVPGCRRCREAVGSQTMI